MSFLEPSELLVPTGRDCPTCKGTGKHPKKRKRPCPERFCHGGQEVEPTDLAEYERRLRV